MHHHISMQEKEWLREQPGSRKEQEGAGRSRQPDGKGDENDQESLDYPPQCAEYFTANQALFNRVVAFYFEVLQAHEGVLDLTTKEALTALESLTHATEKNPSAPQPKDTTTAAILCPPLLPPHGDCARSVRLIHPAGDRHLIMTRFQEGLNVEVNTSFVHT